MSPAEAAAQTAGEVRREVRNVRRRQGLAVALALGALALLVSVFSAGFFLYAAVVTAAVLGIAALLPGASLLGLEARRSLGAESIELGEAVESRLVLHNRKSYPAFWISWRDEVEAGLDPEGSTSGVQTLSGEETVRTACTLHSTRRGLFRIGPAVIEASDPFGLVRRFRVDPDVRFLTVLPRVVPLGAGWPLGHSPIHETPRRPSLFEDPSRFLGIREYQRGDALRRIHWRATARTGRLQVKLYEPAVLEGVLLAVEMGRNAWPQSAAHPGDDPGVELAVTVAASVAEFVLAGGQSVGLISNGGDAAERYPVDWKGGSFRRFEDALEDAAVRRRMPAYRPLEVEPGRGAWHRERLLAALARLTLAPGLTLPELLVAEGPRLPRSLVVLVITPDLGPAMGAALAGLRRSGFDAGALWIQTGEPAPATAAGLPEGVPVHVIANEADLQDLGARKL